jgi:hypothetical protein
MISNVEKSSLVIDRTITPEQINTALEKYGLLGFPISEEIKVLFVELSEMDAFLEDIYAKSAEIDEKIEAFKQQMSEISVDILENRKSFKAISKKNGEMLALGASAACAAIGYVGGIWQNYKKKKIENKQKQLLIEKRKSIANEKRPQIIQIKEILTNSLPKWRMYYEKEKNKEYCLSDSDLEKKIMAFKMPLFSYSKITYMIELAKYFYDLYSFWAIGEECETMPPLQSVCVDDISKDWEMNLIPNLLSCSNVEEKWPVTLLTTISNSYLLMSKVGINFSKNENINGLLLSNDMFIDERNTEQSICTPVLKLLNKNTFYIESRKINESCPSDPKGFGLFDFIYFVFLVGISGGITSLLWKTHFFFYILVPIFFLCLGYFLQDIAKTFPFLHKKAEYCAAMEEYDKSIYSLIDNTIFKVKE